MVICSLFFFSLLAKFPQTYAQDSVPTTSSVQYTLHNNLKPRDRNYIRPLPVLRPTEIVFPATVEKNIMSGREIAWGTGWENYRSQYGGNEFRFLFTRSKRLIFTASNPNNENGQGIVIEVDDKMYTLETPHIDTKELFIPIDDTPAFHHVRVRHFCSGSYSPCDLTITSIRIDPFGILFFSPLLPPRTMAILGDSITVGWGRFNFSFSTSDKLGYQLHNAGIFASTVSKIPNHDGVLDRYKKDIVSYRQDLVIIFMGTNDLGNQIPLEIFQRDYQELIGGIKKGLPDATIITLGILQRKDFTKENIEKYTNVIKTVSESMGVSFIDTYDWLTPDDFADNVHPSLASQDKLASKFYESVSAVIN